MKPQDFNGACAARGQKYQLSQFRAVFTLILVSWTILTSPSDGRLHAQVIKLPFIASVDTMKESRDTETRPLSLTAIQQSVDLAARLNVNYITVDTHWDYPDYMSKWVNAIRTSGRHVWFRIHPNQWHDDNGTTGLMTPAMYIDSERRFILAHLTFFRPGDIFDPCPEPENGLYWHATYGLNWTSNAPNAATMAFNAFVREATDVADATLNQGSIYGVITTIRSMNSFFPLHPKVLEAQTVARLGVITIDSYPEHTTTDPQVAAQSRLSELNAIEQLWKIPIIQGEMGYSNAVAVDDATQQLVLKTEFQALSTLPYLHGINYWVGAGTNQSGGYTHIFAGTSGVWTWRPAAYNLAAFFHLELQRFAAANQIVPGTSESSVE